MRSEATTGLAYRGGGESKDERGNFFRNFPGNLLPCLRSKQRGISSCAGGGGGARAEVASPSFSLATNSLDPNRTVTGSSLLKKTFPSLCVIVLVPRRRWRPRDQGNSNPPKKQPKSSWSQQAKKSTSLSSGVAAIRVFARGKSGEVCGVFAFSVASRHSIPYPPRSPMETVAAQGSRGGGGGGGGGAVCLSAQAAIKQKGKHSSGGWCHF